MLPPVPEALHTLSQYFLIEPGCGKVDCCRLTMPK